MARCLSRLFHRWFFPYDNLLLELASLVQFGKKIHMLQFLHSLRFFVHFGYIFFLVSAFSSFYSIYLKWVLILMLLSVIFFLWLKIIIDFTLFSSYSKSFESSYQLLSISICILRLLFQWEWYTWLILHFVWIASGLWRMYGLLLYW
jgi:hypothetical protein